MVSLWMAATTAEREFQDSSAVRAAAKMPCSGLVPCPSEHPLGAASENDKTACCLRCRMPF